MLVFIDKLVSKGFPLSVSNAIALEERLIKRKAENIPGVNFTRMACQTAARGLALLRSNKVHKLSDSGRTGVYLVGVLTPSERAEAETAAAQTLVDRTPAVFSGEEEEEDEDDAAVVCERLASCVQRLSKAVVEWIPAVGGEAEADQQPEEVVAVMRALEKGVQLVASEMALKKAVSAPETRLAKQEGPVDESLVNVVDVFRMSCTCSWYLQTGHPCRCIYGVTALLNTAALKALPEEVRLRGLWKLVRRRIPHTAEEHALSKTQDDYLASWPPTRRPSQATLGDLLRGGLLATASNVLCAL